MMNFAKWSMKESLKIQKYIDKSFIATLMTE